MKLSLDRKALAAALQGLARVTERRNTIPILGNVLIGADGDSVSLTATDLDIEATTDLAADVAAPGALTVDVGRLAALARAATGETVTLAADDPDAGPLLVSCGRARWTLPTLPAGDFNFISRMDGGPDTVSFAIDGPALADLLARARFAAPVNDGRAMLNGVWFAIEDGDLVAAGTNGVVISRATMPAPEGSGRMAGVILPPKSTDEVIRRAGASREPLTILATAQRVRFSGDGWRLATKLVDARYPDYRRGIPQNFTEAGIVDADALKAAIAEVGVVAGAAASARLTLADAEMAISVSDINAGEATASLPCDYAGEQPAATMIAMDYLRGTIEALASDTVRLEMTDPGSPMKFTSPANDRHLVIVAPRRK